MKEESSFLERPPKLKKLMQKSTSSKKYIISSILMLTGLGVFSYIIVKQFGNLKGQISELKTFISNEPPVTMEMVETLLNQNSIRFKESLQNYSNINQQEAMQQEAMQQEVMQQEAMQQEAMQQEAMQQEVMRRQREEQEQFKKWKQDQELKENKNS
tara:strand:- start:507 stop:977 length:471 start_codon:yes stop_codon:yes gene_type:complete